jgi:hypothetical protein
MISRCARALGQESLFSPFGVSLASGAGSNASAGHPGDPPLIAHVILRQPHVTPQAGDAGDGPLAAPPGGRGGHHQADRTTCVFGSPHTIARLNFGDDHGAAAREVAAMCTWRSITNFLDGYVFVFFGLTVVGMIRCCADFE